MENKKLTDLLAEVANVRNEVKAVQDHVDKLDIKLQTVNKTKGIIGLMYNITTRATIINIKKLTKERPYTKR